MKRSAALLAIYVLVLALVSLAEVWRAADIWLVARSGMLGEPAPLAERIVVINVPLGDVNAMERDRKMLAALLDRLVKDPLHHPDEIVLDIEISNDDRGLPELTAAVERVLAPASHAKLFIAANPDDSPGVQDDLAHRAPFYRRLEGRCGHTMIHSQSGVLWYDAQIEAPDGHEISALPIVVAKGPVASLVKGQTLVRVGTEAERDRHTWDYLPGAAGGEFRPSGGRGGAELDLDDKTVVVGALDKTHDFNPAVNRYGLDLVTWAVSDRINPDPDRPQLIQGPAWAVGMALAMSLVAAALFRGLFQWLPSQRQHLWLLGAVAAALAVAVFAGVVLALHSAGDLYPQWSLVLAGIAAATGLTGYALGARLLIDALKLDMDNPERLTATTHDVFISYSRTPENAKWVGEHVVPALEAAGLKVWFDKKSLLLGTSWYGKLALGIQGSRYFVPIYSEDYFKKAFCRFEIELAAIRRAHETDFILPLARIPTGVPVGYQHINFIDVNERPDFIVAVIAAVKPAAKSG